MHPTLPLLLTPGDPRGIGPEVAARALADARHTRPVWLLGDPEALYFTHPALRDAPTHHGDDAPPPLAPGQLGVWAPAPGEEPVEVRALRTAVHTLRAGAAAALVTGPIHKARLAARGFAYTGHTDLLGALCGVDAPVMAFVGGSLRVALVTVHLPLARVPDAIRAPAVLHVLRTADRALRCDLGLVRPRLLVSGLNPHAGDDGVLGGEERAHIAPAVAEAIAEGIDAVGPISAEACFLRATRGDGDMVIAMYHDQGLAPLKAVDFGRSVNWTLGLPMIRTSVDHGTADDLVGTGRADPSSMHAAIALAERLADQRAAPWMA